MWRNYGGQGESYAIGLDPQADLSVLVDSFDTGGVRVRHRSWSPVRYDAAEQRCLVDAVFDDLPEEIGRAMESFRAGAGREAAVAQIGPLLDDMEQALLLIKHPEFTDERETRFCPVLYRTEEDQPLPPGLVRYRATPYGTAPYVWLTGQPEPGAALSTQPVPLPIRAVAISPSPNGPATVSSMLDLLSAGGYAGVPVVRSRIPFRG